MTPEVRSKKMSLADCALLCHRRHAVARLRYLYVSLRVTSGRRRGAARPARRSRFTGEDFDDVVVRPGS